jgi:hypothetical protein
MRKVEAMEITSLTTLTPQKKETSQKVVLLRPFVSWRKVYRAVSYPTRDPRFTLLKSICQYIKLSKSKRLKKMWMSLDSRLESQSILQRTIKIEYRSQIRKSMEGVIEFNRIKTVNKREDIMNLGAQRREISSQSDNSSAERRQQQGFKIQTEGGVKAEIKMIGEVKVKGKH